MFGVFIDFPKGHNSSILQETDNLAIARFNDLKMLFSLIENYFNDL